MKKNRAGGQTEHLCSWFSALHWLWLLFISIVRGNNHLPGCFQTSSFMCADKWCKGLNEKETAQFRLMLTLHVLPTAHPSFTSLLPSPRLFTPSLLLRCIEVIAPAEPQAVVALRRLPYLLIWPVSAVYHGTLSSAWRGSGTSQRSWNHAQRHSNPLLSLC